MVLSKAFNWLVTTALPPPVVSRWPRLASKRFTVVAKAAGVVQIRVMGRFSCHLAAMLCERSFRFRSSAGVMDLLCFLVSQWEQGLVDLSWLLKG